MRKFGNLSPSAIEPFSFIRRHLVTERFDGRRMFDSHHAPWRTFGATLILKRTRLTIGCRGPIAVFDSTFALIFADPVQRLGRWTSKRICLLIVSEFVGIKLR